VSDTELLPKSQPEPVRRVEVFTGTGRRRAWAADEKARIIAESYAGGETVSAVARRHGLTPQQLFGWRRESRQRAESEADERGLAFTPVIVEASRCRSGASIALAVPSSTPMVEIVIGAATVRIPPGIDAVTLTFSNRLGKGRMRVSGRCGARHVTSPTRR
jgi:transposase